MDRRRVVIMGAAGRDFHDFNVVYRDRPGRRGRRLHRDPDPRASPIGATRPSWPVRSTRRASRSCRRRELERIIRDERGRHGRLRLQRRQPRDRHARRVAGAGRRAPTSPSSGPARTMLQSRRPVVAVGATRTGAGKSQTTRYLAALLAERGLTPVVIRHPMPYGDLVAQRVERFATYEDLDRYETTIEEREEYEPHLDAGRVVYAGVDYEAILRAGRDRGRRHPVGRRQQRLPVLPARPVRRRRRPAAAGRRAPLPPGRDERPDGRRRDHQQDRLGRAGRDRRRSGRRSASSTRRAEIVTARSDLTPGRPADRRASASSSSRTARR